MKTKQASNSWYHGVKTFTLRQMGSEIRYGMHVIVNGMVAGIVRRLTESGVLVEVEEGVVKVSSASLVFMDVPWEEPWHNGKRRCWTGLPRLNDPRNAGGMFTFKDATSF